MEDNNGIIEESPNKRQCPFCGKRVVYQAYVEDGGLGDWCPLCQKSIPITKKDKLGTAWLSFCIFCSIILSSLIIFLL